MTAQPANITALIDAARDSVGREIATLRREAARERETFAAEMRAIRAEWEARLAAVSDLQRQVADRLATLKDGAPGRDGVDGAAGEKGDTGETGPAGRDAEPVTAEQIIDAVRSAPDLLEPIVAAYIEANPPPAGEPGKDGRDGVDGKDGIPGERGADGIDGKDGERGPEGPVGALPIVSAWEDRVYYQGEVVTRDGGVFQAIRDTGKEPTHEDWSCIVRAGRDGTDGRSFVLRGTWQEADDYRELDVVALNGASFVARQDAPGVCPGDGWQLMSVQGKRGKPGEQGPVGKGMRGEPGQSVVALHVDEMGMLTLTNGDGTIVQCDLYDLLSRIGQ